MDLKVLKNWRVKDLDLGCFGLRNFKYESMEGKVKLVLGLGLGLGLELGFSFDLLLNGQRIRRQSALSSRTLPSAPRIIGPRLPESSDLN